MRRFNYPQSFATGAIAAGGTLGAMFPPSIVLAVYGPITQQDIGKLFMATIGIIGLLRPHWLPTAPVANWAERFDALKDIWASLALFISVIGGLHGGLVHPPVGMNVFVIPTVVKDVSFSTIFLGVLPFVVTDPIRLAIPIVFPAIALGLPSRM